MGVETIDFNVRAPGGRTTLGPLKCMLEFLIEVDGLALGANIDPFCRRCWTSILKRISRLQINGENCSLIGSMVSPRDGTLILERHFEVRVDALSEASEAAARANLNRCLHGKPL